MTISGFSMVKNAEKLYYPIKESIMSILPIVDEFVVAVGDCDDNTRAAIESIGSSKIKIIDTIWDLNKYPRGMEHAHQTDIAKQHCKGDWLFYLQADEVIHEKFHSIIVNRCKELLHDKQVDGLIFKYIHFWADYNHYQWGHSWYKHEIRIVRNDPDIHSWESAQSFRRIPNFDGINYRCDKSLTSKLNVALVDAQVYHYGWVRPPDFMEQKTRAFNTNHLGKDTAEQQFQQNKYKVDYGPVGLAKIFKQSHPLVMAEKIAAFNWGEQLNYTKKRPKGTKKPRHERFKYRFISFIESLFFKEFGLFTFKNYNLINK
jgi:hypothetical protein